MVDRGRAGMNAGRRQENDQRNRAVAMTGASRIRRNCMHHLDHADPQFWTCAGGSR